MIEFLSLQPLWLLLALPVLVLVFLKSLVDRPPLFKWGSFIVRLLAITLLILALCRPYWTKKSDDLHVVFLLDASESVPATELRSAMKEVQAATEQLGPRDSSETFLFANDLRPITPEGLETFIKDSEAGRSDAEFRSESNLSSALAEARLSFPAKKARRVVVFTDGTPTEPLTDVLSLLKEEQTDLQWQQLSGRSEPEASVVAITSTVPVAFQGEITRLNIELASNTDMPGTLRILHRGVEVARKTVELKADEPTRENVDVEMVSAGESVWKAELIPEKDHFPINNHASTTIPVRGKPRILIVHQKSEQLRAASRALEKQGIKLDLRGARGLPDSLQGMLAFDAIALADVPATDLRPDQMRWLRDYVTKFGGGLFMFGSENSYGLGGYYKTPIEEVLPLVSRFEKEKEKPSIAMVLVIDKSGSMSGEPIVMARQAALATAELLSGRDQIAVLGFDSNPQLICPLTPAANLGAISTAIESLDASGGTDLQPAMVQAREILESANAKIKHVIAMTDGQTDASNLVEISQEMADQGITVSTVALGSGAAGQLLSEMASAGNGRYYEAAEAQEVPQIFTRETMQASRSAIKEDLYAAAAVTEHPMITGYESIEFPFVLGYVMTKAKPTAQVLLAVESGDPLLAVGRFGLGTGVAFTADLTERWGGEWLAWDGFGSFWAQVFRGALKKEDAIGLATQQTFANDSWHIDLSRQDIAGRPINSVEWDAEVFDQNGKSQPVNIVETGVGRYQAQIPLLDQDRLTLRLSDPLHRKSKTLQWTRGYPAEYRLKTTPDPILASTPLFKPAQIRKDLLPVRIRSSALPAFGFTAIGLLLLSVLLRRI